jgi:pimeloyl-ACP methyl ester carboxylesterase
VPPGAATYAVEDMAADVLTVMDAHGIARAHLVGMSLGGYIAQMLAVAVPDRVLSLTLIGSEPLGWDGQPLPGIAPEFLDHFATLAVLDWADAQAVEAFLLGIARLCAGPNQGFDVGAALAMVRQVMARTGSLPSMFNHASRAVGDHWAGRFRDITCPVLVIHGSADPILPPANGQALADGIRGARLVVLDAVGHDLPAPILPDLAHQIARHTQAAGWGHT